MPKFVRRQPLRERLQAYLNPYDFLLWLSEEIESNGWDQLEKEWALPIAAGLNLIFLIARANFKHGSRSYDDVFGDIDSRRWAAGLATLTVYALGIFSLLNAGFVFMRRKHYRLFENPIEDIPSTPSARRVRLDSTPASSSPLQLLSKVLGTEAAQARAHPDATKDVWEVAVWDPLPVSLRLFCFFSPGHVILYWLFLPTLPDDRRPSVTIATTIFLGVLLAAQLSLICTSFSQQSKDSAVISKEVLHEYDTKYVRPRTQPVYRDVGTQYSEQANVSLQRDAKYNKVETFTPMVVINRGFKPNPNPNYIRHIDPDNNISLSKMQRQTSTPTFRTPATSTDHLSPSRPTTVIRQPVFRPPSDGGSLGIYSHAQSPLRKSASSNFSPSKLEAARDRLLASPEKRSRLSAPTDTLGLTTSTQKPDRSIHDAHRRQTGRY